jgi:DNA-binding helix-hairpin-helix protein with protein kinase domain
MSRISHASQSEIIRPIDRNLHASQSELVRLSQRIGVGAEGEVYEILDRSDLVAKIYHEPPPQEKAEKLVVLSRLGNERLFNLSAWPVDVLREKSDGQIAGFVMKKISQAEEVHALHSPKSRLQKFPEASWAFLIYVAANIARAVAAIHEHGFIIGDVNPKNILVTRKATIYLLDVDSFQVSADGKTYRCEGGFPEYTPPELQGVAFRDVDRAEEHDYFGLAVVIFQLLFIGRHPFSGRYLGDEEMPLERAIRELRFAYGADAETRRMRQPPGTLALDAVPAPLAELFRRAFLSTDRPQPREWITALDALSKSLKKCQLHSGHSYFQDLAECPWCEIETRARVRLFNFLLPGASSQRGHFRLYEIWKEIEGVGAPETPLTEQDKLLKASAPSPEVALFAKDRRNRFFIAIWISAIAGLLIPLLADFPLAFLLVILAALVARSIAKAESSVSGQMQLLFQGQLAVSSDSFVNKVALLKRDADYRVHQIEEKWEKEAGNKPFFARLDELRNRIATYENLSQIRRFRLQQLEAEARKDQLDEFLDQFEINNAEIKGIGSTVKATLLSHGVETAADVIEEVMQIPSIGQSRAEKLLDWRRGLERKFVFDPVRGVPPEARLKVERDVDMLRFRLEHELSGGAYYLRRVKQEIEESRQRLRPVLADARQTLAQAKKDWEVASKRNSLTPIVGALIIAFFIGWSIESDRGSQLPIVADPGPDYVQPVNTRADQNLKNSQEALALYRKGVKLSEEGKYAEAIPVFKKAVELDKRMNAAHEELGYALYRLRKHDEAAEALKQAITLDQSFGPYYKLGLVRIATGNWHEARLAFQRAISLRDTDPYDWKDEYTWAYHHLGHSLLKVGDIQKVIQALEPEIHGSTDETKRFELANLYLWAGKQKAAKEQYEMLKHFDSPLADELLKLMKKHGVRKPA